MTPQQPALGALPSVIEHLCRAFHSGPSGSRLSFFWNPQNTGSLFGPRGYTFYFDEDSLERASLELLSNQATLLTGMPLHEVRSTLLEFFRFHLHLFVPSASAGQSRQPGGCPPSPSANEPASALLAYIQEIRQDKIYLIPARRLGLCADHIGSRILLVRPADQMETVLPKLQIEMPRLNGLQFPPFAHDNAEGQLLTTDCWIGCIARSDQQAFNLLEALLGGVSLLLPAPHSRTFSIASRIPYIYCIGGRWIARLDGPTFPPLTDDQQLRQEDTDVLRRLFEVTRAKDAQQRIELGLQFAGAGWAPPGRFSFLHNAIAFDALFGENRRVREAIQAEVSRLAASIPRITDRIASLITIRNALLHGEINAVEASLEYAPYYEEFKCDPQDDQVRILSTCIRSISDAR